MTFPARVFLLCAVIYAASPVMTPGDSRYATHTAYSLIKHGDTNIDEYEIPADDYRLEVVGSHRYNFFPVWTAVIMVPVVALADWTAPPILAHLPALDRLIRRVAGEQIPLSTPIKPYELYPVLELLLSSLLCALSVALFAMIAAQVVDRSQAAWATLIFALATPMWSTVSRAMWMHSPSVLMLTLTLFILVSAQRGRERYIPWAGATVALAFMFRPTNAVSVVAVSAYVFLNYRRAFLGYVLAAAPLAALYVGYNLLIYHSVVPSYAGVNRLSLHPQFLEALVANWVSPARGLLVFCPIFVLALHGCWCNRRDPLVKMITAVILGHWGVVSAYPHWWAGWSFGPRFFSDMLPLFGYGLLLSLATGILRNRASVRVFAMVATAFSLMLHANGAINRNSFLWNERPADIDKSHGRVWDWSDPQFLRTRVPARVLPSQQRTRNILEERRGVNEIGAKPG